MCLILTGKVWQWFFCAVYSGKLAKYGVLCLVKIIFRKPRKKFGIVKNMVYLSIKELKF